jgi:eukaryotic-like serine/threonine-protein kinase
MNEPTRTPAGATVAPPPIPGYRFVRNLGEGGYAIVYLYQDEQLGREVAVKVLQLLDDDARRQFNNEMRIVSAFDDNPYIVPIFNPGRTADGRLYFIMPFCPRGSLSAKVRDSGAMPVTAVIDTGLCIGRALAAVHAKQLLHRDVKPSNILVDGNGRPRLSDFGIAGPRTPVTAEERENLAVSVAWSPPELLDGGYGSVASDLYSLGATLWHLVIGHSPYEIPGGDNTIPALERRIRAARLPSLRRDGVPPALEALLRSMLATEPHRRPADAEAVLAGLAAIASDDPGGLSNFPEKKPDGWGEEPEDVEPGQNANMTPWARIPARGARGRRVLVPVGAVAALAVALLGAGALLHHSPAAAAHGSPTTSTGFSAAPVGQDAGVLDDEPPGTPTVTATRVDPGALQFAWTYSASQATDTFEWRATDGPQSGTASTPTIEVTDPAGTELCIQVRVVRANGDDASFSWSPAGCGS